MENKFSLQCICSCFLKQETTAQDNVSKSISFRGMQKRKGNFTVEDDTGWPCWLTDSGRLTHKVIIRPASSLAQDRERSPAETSVLPTLLRRYPSVLASEYKLGGGWQYSSAGLELAA